MIEFVKNGDHQLEALNGIQVFYIRTQRSVEILRQIIDMVNGKVVNRDALLKWKMEGGGGGLVFSSFILV